MYVYTYVFQKWLSKNKLGSSKSNDGSHLFWTFVQKQNQILV